MGGSVNRDWQPLLLFRDSEIYVTPVLFWKWSPKSAGTRLGCVCTLADPGDGGARRRGLGKLLAVWMRGQSLHDGIGWGREESVIGTVNVKIHSAKSWILWTIRLSWNYSVDYNQWSQCTDKLIFYFYRDKSGDSTIELVSRISYHKGDRRKVSQIWSAISSAGSQTLNT